MAESTIPQSVRDIIEWFTDEYTSIMQAYEIAAKRNEDTAGEIAGELPQWTKTLQQSADNWRAKATNLRELYAALPDNV